MTGGPSTTSPHRRLLGLAALVCLGLQFPGTVPWAAAALTLWLALLAALERPVLRALWRPRFWAFTLGLAVASGLLLGPREASGVWSVLSRQGLEAGLLMVLRGALIFGLAGWASRAVSGAEIQRAAARVGLPGLGTAVSTALSLLPGLSAELRRLAPSRDAGGILTLPRQVQGSAVWLVTRTARLAQRVAAGDEAAVTLAEIFSSTAARPLVAAVVGPPHGSGKTTLVSRLADELVRAGVRVGGVVQPALLEGGVVAGYAARDLASGEERELARRLPGGGTERGLGFRFNDAAWAWAGERLLEARQEAELLIIDELGRLEARGEGHLPALLRALEPGGPAAVLLAVRDECADDIQDRLGPFDLVIHPDAGDRDVKEFTAKLQRRVRPGRVPPRTA